MSREISLQTAARLLAGSIANFDNAGTSRNAKPAPKVPGIGWTVLIFLIAAAIAVFAT